MQYQIFFTGGDDYDANCIVTY